MATTMQSTWAVGHEDDHFFRPETGPMVCEQGATADVLERLADSEREDNALLRMILACSLATAVLALAGGLLV